MAEIEELVCMWLHPSGNLSFIDDAVIVECRDVCRKGELQLAQFRPNHVCGAIKLIKQMEIRYVPCSCLLTYLCHDKLHSLVKAHMRSMERNSQIPAIVDHILLIMIFDGVAMQLRYVGIHSTSLGFLYGLVPTKANPDVFSSRFQYHEVSWSVCDFDFGLTLLLSSVSLSQRLSGHDYKLNLWSTSLVMQRMQNIQKQLRVVGFCCTPLEFLFGLLGWNHVSTLLGLNLKLSPDIGDLQLDVSSCHMFDVVCRSLDEAEYTSMANVVSALHIVNNLVFLVLLQQSFHLVSLQRQSQDYDFIRQTIVVHSDWFGSILEFLYGSLPRPPDVLYVFSPQPTILMVVQVQDAAHNIFFAVSTESSRARSVYSAFQPLYDLMLLLIRILECVLAQEDQSRVCVFLENSLITWKTKNQDVVVCFKPLLTKGDFGLRGVY